MSPAKHLIAFNPVLSGVETKTEIVKMLFFSYCVLALTAIALCAVPLPRPVPSIQAARAHQPPTCIPGPKSLTLGPSANTLHAFSVLTYASDCLLALNSLLNSPYSHQAWIWKRFNPGQVPPPGYAPLPYDIAVASCTVELDVLSDVTAEDEIALRMLKPDLMWLLRKCIWGKKGGFAAGYVLVGPRKMIALTLKPTPSGFGGGKGQREGLDDERKRKR